MVLDQPHCLVAVSEEGEAEKTVNRFDEAVVPSLVVELLRVEKGLSIIQMCV